MNGRCLSKSKANLTEIDVSLRNNVHKYKAFLYGFAHEQTLSADIDLELIYDFYFRYYKYINSNNINMISNANMLLKRLTYLRSAEINMILKLDEYIKCYKYIAANKLEMISDVSILLKHLVYLKNEQVNLILRLEQLNIKKNVLLKSISNMDLSYNLSFLANSFSKADLIRMYSTIGKIDIGNVVAHFDNMFIKDLNNLTIEDITKIIPSIYGLDVHKNSYMRMIDNMNLSSNIDFLSKQFPSINEILLYSSIGTFNAGKVISDFDGMVVENLNGLTIEDIIGKRSPIYGLRVTKNSALKLISDMYLSTDFIGSVSKNLKSDNISLYSSIGTFNTGKIISDFDGMVVENINPFTIGDITGLVPPKYGLNAVNIRTIQSSNDMELRLNKMKFALVYKAKLNDLEGLYLSDLGGLTIDKISQTRIV